MDLELQILRDKVIEDEKNSGIGSLYDDDKTSHQHIQKLKEKYGQHPKVKTLHLKSYCPFSIPLLLTAQP